MSSWGEAIAEVNKVAEDEGRSEVVKTTDQIKTVEDQGEDVKPENVEIEESSKPEVNNNGSTKPKAPNDVKPDGSEISDEVRAKIVSEIEAKYADYENLKKTSEEYIALKAQVDAFEADPKSFIEKNFPQFKYQATEKTIDEKIRELKKKFGPDFVYDPSEARDPDSASFKYDYEYDRIKQEHMQEEVSRKFEIQKSMEENRKRIQESLGSVARSIEKVKSDYGLKDDVMNKFVQEHMSIKDDPIKQFESWLLLKVKAEYGLNKTAERMKAQDQIEKEKADKLKSTPVSGKSASKSRSDDDRDFDFLFQKQTRSGY